MSEFDEIRELATRKVSVAEGSPQPSASPNESPQPSASRIGELCRDFVDFAKKHGYIPKGRVRAFEERAQRLREEGIEACAWFRGAYFALGTAPELCGRFGNLVDSWRSWVMRRLHRRVYETKRVALAKQFVALESELLPTHNRGRGRPKGKGVGDEQDFAVYLNALRHTYAREDVTRRAFDADLKESIAKAGFPRRGSTLQEDARVHRQRIKRKIPKFVDDMERRAERHKKSE